MTAFDRGEALRRMADERFDVLVVGGGITGAGVAVDAATRGLRVALVERGDWASGTSSKSSKLVHGGVRYLQQGEVRLVYQALAERERLRRAAPHLVKLLPFLIPVHAKGGIIDRRLRAALSAGLWLYDITGGARCGKFHERVDVATALAHVPTLRPEDLVGGFVYYDAQTDDARLTLTIARTAADHGAACASRTSLVGLAKGQSDRVASARLRTVEGEEFEVRVDSVVNATGVWSDEIRTLDEGSDPRAIRASKGIHIAVPWDRVRNEIATVIPTADKRMVFAVPLGNHTYIGTTDEDYDGPLDRVLCTREEVGYLLDALNRTLVSSVSADDVVGSWAGLRPLVRTASSVRSADMSRRHTVTASRTGVVTVNGGKLTTYRRMAADAVDEVMGLLGRRGPTVTHKLPLHGAEGADAVDDLCSLQRHGGDRPIIEALMADDPSLANPLVPGLPYVRAEAVHAVRHEMALTLDDVLTRRTQCRSLAADASARAAEQVAQLLATELCWDEPEVHRQVADFRSAVGREVAALAG